MTDLGTEALLEVGRTALRAATAQALAGLEPGLPRAARVNRVAAQIAKSARGDADVLALALADVLVQEAER